MGKSQSEPQEKELQKQTDAVLRLLTKRGILPNDKITDEKRRAALQKRQKESYTIIVPKWDWRDAASSEAAFCFAIFQEGGSENGEKAR